ncbi:MULTISPECIES: hypothetical protein [Neisseria]|uniref:hypothetical protein n=1 Tax=Neisseria TaxID=482 RepID=UPI000A18C23D|nr:MULTISPECIES: hypothetical protein [Neisseria]MDO1510285.1 hypothetical protein [Neisseria sp. MVDL19-042950]MDO1516454.1 hypothetical protein [Neisseria sp. MVDL18-041461]MDO1563602.1 hypothetical protein [Neisseria sp. MVDL20-010259]MDO5073243.1 hypothetical protein [Neisseria animaloris]OSI07690.1 hypothetical protein BWD08_05865 [Neisseria animaloris]
MTNNANATVLPVIPAKRYFTLDEMCELVQISPAQFAQWQHENGMVIGYGGDRYTRLDVVKLRKLKDTFAPFVDEFNHNALDADGNPAIQADEMRAELQKLLAGIEKTLAS